MSRPFETDKHLKGKRIPSGVPGIRCLIASDQDDRLIAVPSYISPVIADNKKDAIDNAVFFARQQVMERYGNVISHEINDGFVHVLCKDEKMDKKLSIVYQYWDDGMFGKSQYRCDSIIKLNDDDCVIL